MGKQSEIIKNLVERTIGMKYMELQDMNFSDMEESEVAEYEKANKKMVELQTKLFNIIPKEYHGLINECLDAVGDTFCIEENYIFNRGVKVGLNDLYYIREEMKGSMGLLQ